MCVLTFQSLEDAIVKERFRRFVHTSAFSYPHNAEVLRPTINEVAANPRSRSARARFLQRL
jgi:16S rRNA (cytosine1402-N4)-methyltransferase